MKSTISTKQTLTKQEQSTLLQTLQSRFEKNIKRHPDIDWEQVQTRLKKNPTYLWSLNEMEKTGGEPDLLQQPGQENDYFFCDCSPESPTGRRSVCYDQEALEFRKEARPATSAIAMADAMGVKILSEDQYRLLQKFGPVDQKTSSWLQTPAAIRKLGGAIFGDFRYGTLFVYHNGAQSYYASRGFRAALQL